MRTRADLLAGMTAFSTLLRTEYGIAAAHGDTRDALLALEAVGIDDEHRVRDALRVVYCGKRDELERFDRAFEVFFHNHASGVRQRFPSGTDAGAAACALRRLELDEDAAEGAQHMRAARYSPAASRNAQTPRISAAGLAEMLVEAHRLITALRMGRSRRWKPNLSGSRFDMRRTLRASLQTGGDPAHIRTLGHPLRNPRIVMLIDASRSMGRDAEDLLQFAYALRRRSQRTRVFAFSTSLREITRELRDSTRSLPALGEAWGGGTRIGACLSEFLRMHASALNADTLVIIASDGLDVGDVALLERAMHRLARRCAGIVWLNPHAGTPGFTPEARGMQAALPYVDALIDARDLRSLVTAARRVSR